MDPEIQRRARTRAAELGISFAEFVRRAVDKELGDPKPTFDITQMFDLIKDGPRTNIARDKDKLIGEAVWEDYLRSTGRKPRRSQAKTASRRR